MPTEGEWAPLPLATKHESLGYEEDEDLGGYEWGFSEVFKDTDVTGKETFYIIRDSGCSCNGPASNYGPVDASFGPCDSLGELLESLTEDPRRVSSTTAKAYLDAIKKLNNQTLESIKKALNL